MGRSWNFPENCGRLCAVDKQTHARLFRQAMAERGYDRTVVADATGVKPRTVTNWRSGTTMPSDREMAALRKLLGPYDIGGDVDPVERAVKGSRLTEDRQFDVIGYYKRQLRLQDAEEVG